METRSLQYLSQACQGRLLSGIPDMTARRVVIDSREVTDGDLFFAIRGDRFDGHDFLDQVAAQGASAVVVDESRLVKWPSVAIIAVDEPRAALGRLAGHYRNDFRLSVVAVGGSNGKTTTKEIIAALLGQKFETLKSPASFNNDIGVPLTLLNIETNHRAAVLEVGTNHPGELAPLLQWVRPRLGVITSIGHEHLEFFGDLDGVVKEEGELAAAIPADGTLFLNGEMRRLEEIAERTKADVVRVGFSKSHDISATRLELDASGVTFWVNGAGEALDGKYRLPLLGRHQVTNALLAIAVAGRCGCSREQISNGLLLCRPAKMRMESFERGGVRILNDAYNANLDSMIAGIETLRDLNATGRKVAVCGEMAELGEHSLASHREAGRSAAVGIDCLMTVGVLARDIAEGARDAGCREVHQFDSVEEAGPVLQEWLKPGDVVLLKASRAMRLERLVEWLTPRGEGRGACGE